MLCNPAANPPLPPNVAPIGQALTRNMVLYCEKLSADFSLPIGYYERTVTDGVPVVYVIMCHDRHANETQPSGQYHACEVHRDTMPAPAPTTHSGLQIKGGLVAVGIVVLAIGLMARGGRK